jgi:hypothetical protein
MKRRIVTAVALIAYLAGQWAALPHAHAGERNSDHSGHNSRPHVHFSWFGHDGHSHAHEHDGADHHRSRHSRRSAEPVCDASLEKPADHESDAIYLPDEVGAAATAAKNATTVDLLVISPFMSSAISMGPADGIADTTAWRIADESSIGCPLYLALRALRI